MAVVNDVITRAVESDDPNRHSVMKRLYVSLCQTIARVCDAMPSESLPQFGCSCVLCACTLNRLQYEAGIMGYELVRPNPIGTGKDPTMKVKPDLQ
jgi:hypothetical protein